MNSLPELTVTSLLDLASKGESRRAIARALGISTATVARYIPKGCRSQRCPCGEVAGHKGWCKARYANSVARQAFRAARSGKVIELPPPLKISRQNGRASRAQRWLGKREGFTSVPLAFAEMFGVIGEVKRACKNFPRDVCDDVEQEVILRTFEGLIFRDEIPLAAKYFLGLQYRHVAETFSIDQILGGWGRVDADEKRAAA